MSGSPKLGRVRSTGSDAKAYATAIGGAALAGAAVGPLGAVGGALGVAVGCALHYYCDDEQRDECTSNGPEEQ